MHIRFKFLMMGVGFAAWIFYSQAASAGLPEPITVPLWEGDPPDMVQDAGPELVDERGSVQHVSVPAMAVYLPAAEQATGQVVIVCPGGSYRQVGRFATGMGAVELFLPRGIAVVVLKYRTRPPSPDVRRDALADAKRAVRLVRHHAKAWRIDPQRIDMLGSSAGSHLVLNLATHWDHGQADHADPVERQSCRPDFVTLLCPWPWNQGVEDFPINAQTPPALICSALDDPIAPTRFAKDIAKAYRQAKVPATFWTVEKGGHRAFTIGGRGPGGRWVDQYWAWLDERHERHEGHEGACECAH